MLQTVCDSALPLQLFPINIKLSTNIWKNCSCQQKYKTIVSFYSHSPSYSAHGIQNNDSHENFTPEVTTISAELLSSHCSYHTDVQSVTNHQSVYCQGYLHNIIMLSGFFFPFFLFLCFGLECLILDDEVKMISIQLHLLQQLLCY